MSQYDTINPFEPVRPYDPLQFNLPSQWRIDIAAPRSIEPLTDVGSSVSAALADPLHSPPLRELVGLGDQVCLVFTHPAVHCPEHLLLPSLLRELEKAGVQDRDITLLRAGGLFERTSHEQNVIQLGPEVVERYHVVDHDVGEVIHLGQWQSIPLTVNRRVLEADLVIATGIVAPHLYYGYSGGADTVAIGCAGDATIEAIHAPRFIYHPKVAPGQIPGNPFQEMLWSIAERVGLRFVLDAILDASGQVVDVQAGDPFLVHQHMVFSSSNMFNKPLSRTYDVVIAGLDSRYDSNLYQAVLGALFVGTAPYPAVRRDGVIILPARIPEAVGQSINAQNFYNALQGVRSLDELITDLLERGYRPGEARAFQLARLLEQNKVFVVGSEFPAIVNACHLHESADLEEAIDQIHWLLGDDLDVLIIPNALHTLPILATPDSDGWPDVAIADEQTW